MDEVRLDDPDLLTLDEAAALVGRSKRTVQNWRRGGHLVDDTVVTIRKQVGGMTFVRYRRSKLEQLDLDAMFQVNIDND
jgi:hypothetical protein